MRTRMKWAVLPILAIASYATSVFASQSGSNATITAVGYNGTVAWVSLAADLGGTKPACTTDKRDLVFDPTTAAGKTFLSLAESAKLSGRLVDLSGTGTCTNLGSTPVENLSYIKIRD